MECPGYDDHCNMLWVEVVVWNVTLVHDSCFFGGDLTACGDDNLQFYFLKKIVGVGVCRCAKCLVQVHYLLFCTTLG
jgi:hypothetical protein